jgi:hypothetical protein
MTASSSEEEGTMYQVGQAVLWRHLMDQLTQTRTDRWKFVDAPALSEFAQLIQWEAHSFALDMSNGSSMIRY